MNGFTYRYVSANASPALLVSDHPVSASPVFLASGAYASWANRLVGYSL
jgi:hypothetical protein